MHPNQDECFILRMQLINVPGPWSFQQLKFVDGVTNATLRALNLLENDQQWDIYVLMLSATLHMQT